LTHSRLYHGTASGILAGPDNPEDFKDEHKILIAKKTPTMPVFQLTQDSVFPPVHWASKSGLLAVGGDLSPRRLLEAYLHGIFPWYAEAEPILWWSPDPRFVLLPEELKITRSMRQFL
jgi:hypothetical protein